MPEEHGQTPGAREAPGLLIVGCGFTGMAAARIAQATGRPVTGTTRRAEGVDTLMRAGITPLLLDESGAAGLAFERAVDGADCVVCYPPDAQRDAALIPRLMRARACTYISSTAVYGSTRGRIDDLTPIAPSTPRGTRRAAAERRFLDAGAVVLRAPGIYGPGRGVHIRLAQGRVRLVEGGNNHISRIHVEDLATLALSACMRGEPGRAHAVGDLHPTPQRELVEFLCEHLDLPRPPSVPAEQVDESLRGDRQVDPRPALAALGHQLAFPTYREGYADAITRHGANLSGLIPSG